MVQFPELRRSFVNDDWVIVASERSLRPTDTGEGGLAPSEACPFCPGNEHMTPPEVFACRYGTPPDSAGWSIRAFQNSFPALRQGEWDRRQGPLSLGMSGTGVHEVIVETPDHGSTLADMDAEQAVRVMHAYRERFRAHASDAANKHVAIFKNHGERAGASLSHSHSQLIASPFVPELVRREMERCAPYGSQGLTRCLYDDLAREERAAGARVVTDEGRMLLICPEASRVPFEMLVIPENHSPCFSEAGREELRSLAAVLQDATRRLSACAGDPPFNLYLHSAIRKAEGSGYHWHVHIFPRITDVGGYEVASGVFINQTRPEDAAEELRRCAQ